MKRIQAVAVPIPEDTTIDNAPPTEPELEFSEHPVENLLHQLLDHLSFETISNDQVVAMYRLGKVISRLEDMKNQLRADVVTYVTSHTNATATKSGGYSYKLPVEAEKLYLVRTPTKLDEEALKAVMQGHKSSLQRVQTSVQMLDEQKIQNLIAEGIISTDDAYSWVPTVDPGKVRELVDQGVLSEKEWEEVNTWKTQITIK